MPKMAEIVNSYAAAIDRCFASLQRFEVFDAITQAVCEAQGQRSGQALTGGYGPLLPARRFSSPVDAVLLLSDWEESCHCASGWSAAQRLIICNRVVSTDRGVDPDTGLKGLSCLNCLESVPGFVLYDC